ncbi:hypothetical protein [Chamaesiphon minutus]|uniref:DUF7873 family protein n=1 Tax=Chamaesiphon minutus TaxID=1173032 RepID=UPI0002D81B90|nr:hypothetical protein [Chamaesiphon minutus]
MHLFSVAAYRWWAVPTLLGQPATQDYANTEAKASIEIDCQTIISHAPGSYLLFLEN